MSTNTIPPHLLKTPVFSALSATQIPRLSRRMMRHALRADEVLFRQGSPGKSMAVVEFGTLEVRVSMTSGRTVTVARLGPSDVVGEMTCLDPAPRSATVVATENASIFLFSNDAFRKLETEAPDLSSGLCQGILRQIHRRLLETNDRIERALRGAPQIRDIPLDLAPSVSTHALSEHPIDVNELAQLREMEPKHLKLLLQIAPARQVAAGTVLAHEGDLSKNCFILARGSVGVSRIIDGVPQSLATLSAGSMMGQLALIGGAPRSATLTAETDCVLLFLGSEDFWQLLRGETPFSLGFQRQLAVTGIRQLRGATARVAGLLTNEDTLAIAPDTTPAPSLRAHSVQLARIQASLSDWELPNAR